MDELAARVGERMPALAGAALRPVGDGWTCDTYEATDADDAVWIIQSPRTAYAVERLRAQAALLPELAHEVSATIPSPAVPLGDPPLLIYPRIEGVPCDETGGGSGPSASAGSCTTCTRCRPSSSACAR